MAAQGPLLVLAYGLPPLTGHLAAGAERIAAIGLIVLAIAFGLRAARVMGNAFTAYPRPVEAGQLVTRGPFAYVRHPIYSGVILACAGWGWLWQSAVGAAFVVALLVFFDLKARREERWLVETYPDYTAYSARVKRLVPFIY